MPVVRIQVRCPLHSSFRVQQIAGMFDVPSAAASDRSFEVELPDEDEEWRIGVIVGPSASGKTTVARQAFGDAMYAGGDWPRAAAVIDGFGDLPTKRIVQSLTAVGFSSPPAWLRPYHVLSGGERFRCDLARALLSASTLVVFDEFTSVVDRTVARIGAAAVVKAVRGGWFDEAGRGEEGRGDTETGHNPNPRVSASPCPGVLFRRFVAVTCHYDVLDWLEPDWVLDMADGGLKRRRLRQCDSRQCDFRRPPIELEIFRCHHSAWRVFGPHHYLSGELNKAARCYVATWQAQPVAFCALLNCIGLKGVERITRIVVLPDYQGLGIGGRFCDCLGELNHPRGVRTTITTSHPAMLHHFRRSPNWRIRSLHKGGHPWSAFGKRKNLRASSAGRTVVGAEYLA